MTNWQAIVAHAVIGQHRRGHLTKIAFHFDNTPKGYYVERDRMVVTLTGAQVHDEIVQVNLPFLESDLDWEHDNKMTVDLYVSARLEEGYQELGERSTRTPTDFGGVFKTVEREGP